MLNDMIHPTWFLSFFLEYLMIWWIAIAVATPYVNGKMASIDNFNSIKADDFLEKQKSFSSTTQQLMECKENSLSCRCYQNSNGGGDSGMIVVHCAKKNLTMIPRLPKDSHLIYLSSNRIQSIKYEFRDLSQLLKLDLSSNDISVIHNHAFKDCRRLAELKLHNNKITEFPSFSEPNGLTHIYLQHNQIKQLAPVSVKSLGQLLILDLGFNNISQLVPGTFSRSNHKLRQLFLNNNAISQLYPGFFDGLTSLEWLRLSKNKIHQLPDSLFDKLRSLKFLELNRNKLGVIRSLAFKGLVNLKVLKIKRNNLHTLKDGAFWGLLNIQLLQLDFNAIVSIEREWLYGLEHLEKLSVTHNRINSINPDTWDTLPKLTELDFSHNLIEALSDGSFKDLNNLKRLSLRHNNISSVSLNSFTGLNSIHSLDLSENQFQNALLNYDVESSSATTNFERENSVLNSLNNDYDVNRQYNPLNRVSLLLTNPLCSIGNTLKILKLRSNSIYSISLSQDHNECLLDTIRNLVSFDVSDNKIQRIVLDVNQTLEPLPKTIHEILVNTSSLLCDCNIIRQLSRWLSPPIIRAKASSAAHYPSSHIYAKCLYPPALEGFDVISASTIGLNSHSKKFISDEDSLPLPNICKDPSSSYGNFQSNDVIISRDTDTSARHKNSNEFTSLVLAAIHANKKLEDLSILNEIFVPQLPVTLLKHPSTREELIEGAKRETLTCVATLQFLSRAKLTIGSSKSDKKDSTDFSNSNPNEEFHEEGEEESQDQHHRVIKKILNVKWFKGGGNVNQMINLKLDLPAANAVHYETRDNYTLRYVNSIVDSSAETENSRPENVVEGEGTSVLYRYSLLLVSKLTLKPVVLSAVHEGIYKCNAVTELKSSVPSLEERKHPEDIVSTIDTGDIDRSEIEGRSVISPKLRVTVLIPPYFTRPKNSQQGAAYLLPHFPLTPSEPGHRGYGSSLDTEISTAFLAVRVGGTARLECLAEGNPRPRVAWQKIKKVHDQDQHHYPVGNVNYEIADFPAARERRMRVMHPSSSDTAFYITNVRMVDDGLYLCKARNRAGVARHRLVLQVMEVPTFTRPLVDKTLKVDSTVILECLATGNPEPSITWFKDGHEIITVPTLSSPSSNKRTNRKNSKNLSPSQLYGEESAESKAPLKARIYFLNKANNSLVITKSLLSDTGLYECVVQNTLGKISSAAKLVIVSTSSHLTRPEDDATLTSNLARPPDQDQVLSPDDLVDLVNQINLQYERHLDETNNAKATNDDVPPPRRSSNGKSFYEEDTDFRHIQDFLESEDSSVLSKPRNAVKIAAHDSLIHHSQQQRLQSGSYNGNSPQDQGPITIRHGKGGSGSGGSTKDEEGRKNVIVVLAVVSCAVITSIIWVLVIYTARWKRFKQFLLTTNATNSPDKFIMISPSTPASSTTPHHHLGSEEIICARRNLVHSSKNRVFIKYQLAKNNSDDPFHKSNESKPRSDDGCCFNNSSYHQIVNNSSKPFANNVNDCCNFCKKKTYYDLQHHQSEVTWPVKPPCKKLKPTSFWRKILSWVLPLRKNHGTPILFNEETTSFETKIVLHNNNNNNLPQKDLRLNNNSNNPNPTSLYPSSSSTKRQKLKFSRSSRSSRFNDYQSIRTYNHLDRGEQTKIIEDDRLLCHHYPSKKESSARNWESLFPPTQTSTTITKLKIHEGSDENCIEDALKSPVTFKTFGRSRGGKTKIIVQQNMADNIDLNIEPNLKVLSTNINICQIKEKQPYNHYYSTGIKLDNNTFSYLSHGLGSLSRTIHSDLRKTPTTAAVAAATLPKDARLLYKKCLESPLSNSNASFTYHVWDQKYHRNPSISSNEDYDSGLAAAPSPSISNQSLFNSQPNPFNKCPSSSISFENLLKEKSSNHAISFSRHNGKKFK